MTMFTGVVLVLALLIGHSLAQTEIHIVPATGKPCPNSSQFDCFDINTLGERAATYSSSSDLVVSFLEGTHMLELEQMIIFNNLKNATFVGLGTMEQGFRETVLQSTVVIKCVAKSSHMWNSGIGFIGGSNIKFKLITITNCAGAFKLYTASLGFATVKDIVIDHVSIQNGSGLNIVTTATNITISSSSFVQNELCPVLLNSCFEANVYIIYSDILICPSEITVYTTLISNSNISHGLNNSLITGGLQIELQQASYGVRVVLDNIVSVYQRVGYGLAFTVYQSVPHYDIVINNTIVGYSEGGLKITTSRAKEIFCDDLPKLDSNIKIYNSNFTNLKGYATRGIYISIDTSIKSPNISIESSTIKNSVFSIGSALYIFRVFRNSLWNIALKNVIIKNNTIKSNSLSATIGVFYATNMSLNNVVISGNSGTALVAYSSTVTIATGSESFIENNCGINGGGLGLYEDSTLLLGDKSVLNFIGNKAKYRGGAIYIDGHNPLRGYTINSDELAHGPLSFGLCFFQYVNLNAVNSTQVFFTGNKADEAGTVVYGGSFAGCTLTIDPESRTIGDNFHKTFNYSLQQGLSRVTSDAIDVCFCEHGVPICKTPDIYLIGVPGDHVLVYVAMMGCLQSDCIVPGTIQVQGSDQKPIFFNSKPLICTGITFTIKRLPPDTESSIIYNITSSRIPESEKIIRITIEKCPIGFELSATSKICDCPNKLLQEVPNITCTVATRSYSRSGNLWIAVDNTSFNNCVVSEECPYDYCNIMNESFKLTDPQTQCSMNRTGILCGECLDGFSLILGSNNCQECPNSSGLILILPLALLGFALVVLLILLNLTVSIGLINGIIFYANVVKISENIFHDSSIPVLSQFISWVNLDLGIETCFYNGMNSYVKVALQFVFPVYIWLIILIIIIACRYSSWLSKKIGANIVPVLATLILLSYTKIFRTIALVLTGAQITCLSGETRKVWFIDGSVGYLGTWQHIVLFLAALFFLLLSVPYTIALFGTILIDKFVGKIWLFSKWWLKFKPLLDAYNGPYKDSCRFWTGFLLLTRLLLVTLVSSGIREEVITVVIITATAILFTVIVLCGGLYMNKFLDFLECWTLLNLAFLFALSNYSETYAFIISVSLMLFTFSGALLYHLILRLAPLKKMICRKKVIKDYEAIHPVDDNEVVIKKCSHTKSEVTVDRESLIFPEN